MTEPIRVVVADDHPLIRAGVRALLLSLDGMDLVGEAADGDEAIAVTQQTRPDVVLMDLQMPGTDGVTATRAITTRLPDTAVLVLTMIDDDASVFAAMCAGARGYLLKGAGQDELHRAVAAVAHGEAIFGPRIAARVLTLLANPPQTTQTTPFPQLTDRERQVLDELASGHTNTVIARTLGINGRTVANHVSSILTKLHLADRSQAIVRAREAGLGHRRPV